MAIRSLPKSIPSKLPSAKLYLDDIEDICEILRCSGAEGELKTTFTIGDSRTCDTIEDLRKLGGRCRIFKIDVRGRDASHKIEIYDRTYLSLYNSQGESANWSTYAKLAVIFEKRKINRSVSVLLSVLLFGLMLGLAFVVRRNHVFYGAVRIALYAAAFPIGYYLLPRFFGPVVIMRSSFEVGTGRWWEEHRSQVLMLVIGALIGGIISAVISKLLN